MSPAESKSLSHPNRTKMFSDSLSKNLAAQKWDLIKVVCSQPFNKRTQFGTSFINIIVYPDPNDQPKIGDFGIRTAPIDGDEDQDPIRIGSFFAKRMDALTSRGELGGYTFFIYTTHDSNSNCKSWNLFIRSSL